MTKDIHHHRGSGGVQTRISVPRHTPYPLHHGSKPVSQNAKYCTWNKQYLNSIIKTDIFLWYLLDFSLHKTFHRPNLYS